MPLLLKKLKCIQITKVLLLILMMSLTQTFFNDYVDELNVAKKNKQISSLESELLKNPDEASYNQYLSLKNS